MKEKVREEDKDAGRDSDGYHLDIVHLTCDSHIYVLNESLKYFNRHFKICLQALIGENFLLQMKIKRMNNKKRTTKLTCRISI